MSAGEGQELASGEAVLSRTAGVIFLAQTGRQAVGISRPTAGETRVEPAAVCLARERSLGAVPSWQAARGLGWAEAGLGEDPNVLVLLLCVQALLAEQRAITV